MDITIRAVTIEDYNTIFELWNSTEQSRRALNPVDDSREGIERYLKRNPETCFLACESNHAHRYRSINTIDTKTNHITTLHSIEDEYC